jgi:hypothetical protein
MARFFRIDVCRLLQSSDWSKETGPSPVDLFKEEKKKRKAAAKKKAKKKAAPKKGGRR